MFEIRTFGPAHGIMVYLSNKIFKLVLAATVNVLKFQTLFTFCFQRKCVIRAGIHKILLRIANREDPDQTASSEAV